MVHFYYILVRCTYTLFFSFVKVFVKLSYYHMCLGKKGYRVLVHTVTVQSNFGPSHYSGIQYNSIESAMLFSTKIWHCPEIFFSPCRLIDHGKEDIRWIMYYNTVFFIVTHLRQNSEPVIIFFSKVLLTSRNIQYAQLGMH